MRAAAALLLLVALAGCGGDSKPEGPSAASIVDAAVASTGAEKSFHFKLDVQNPPESASGLDLTFADGDLVVPDRLRAKVAGSFNGIPLTSEIVFAGPKQFLRNPITGSWQAFSTATSPIAFFSPAKGVLAAIKAVTDLQLAGSETVGGIDCWHLTGTVKARDVTGFLGKPPSDMPVDADLYVGKQDHLLRRLRLSGPVADGEPDDVVRTVDVSRYGEHVTIEAPAAK
jgi:LppX_LprAFG lipoprotein